MLGRARASCSQRVRLCPTRGRQNLKVVAASTSLVQAPQLIRESGVYTVRGTVRKANEDTFQVQVSEDKPQVGEPSAFAAVYDGHGGVATAQWLSKNFISFVEESWRGGKMPEQCIADAHIEADKFLLRAKSGFLGLGERGIGGARCGATAACVLLYLDGDGTTKLLTSNVGDARVLLCSGGKAVELYEEHVPDMESERERIEAKNPNPKMPLVRYVAGTWRTGGLLALSRAFGDAYLKGSLQFEGIRAGGDNYSSGFGVIAEPYTTLNTLTDQDTWMILASDGLFSEEARGGGGGLDNQQAIDICKSSKNESCNSIAQKLATAAQKVGSTDDVTVVVLKLC